MHLRNGEHFPTITASRVGGGEMTIPQGLADRWAVLLFYRGHWCPYCRQQLLDFQRAKAQLNELGAEVVALSVDSLEQAQQTVERHRLTFPVLYGLDARANAVTNLKCVHFHTAASCLRSLFLLAQRRNANHVRSI
jgi:peroxiredoxin